MKKILLISCAALFLANPVFAQNAESETDSEKNSALTVENRDSAENTESAESAENPRDPWEPFNRKMYAVHDVLYRGIIRPISMVYEFGAPPSVHFTIRNGTANPKDAWSALNNVLQAKPKEAGTDILRVLINSTLGIFGIFDVAGEFGIAKTEADFGQTLATWGVPDGNYIFLPILGPKYGRDLFGWVIDTNPLWFAFDPPRVRNTAIGFYLLESAAEVLPFYRMLDETGMDPYVMIRESYFQMRQNHLKGGSSATLEENDDYSKE